ncbi:uncharacterized protein BYT42DRAFT_582794 [Radiomyces spectabilis]|uniref:uncharacterized protein n=1 Tax=Radiomyces spectabilis TaxID=64574 RepID=UPI00221F945F|nr:uncharacterized protein BYT42DRAFT_582794 [Radiomyces spectabilis]KAI8370543.1 hypothetical protein BYT42DRAFT_582794 [Radiomyces spectabilis]
MTVQEDWIGATPLKAPIMPALYPLLAYICISSGLLISGIFAVQSKNTSLAKQLQTSLLASMFLGFGAIFTSISVGIYV